MPTARRLHADAQNIQLQEAFVQGMEPLLGVSRRRAYEPTPDEESPNHISVGIEREEEDRFEAGIGAGGPFGNMVGQVGNEGIERTVWEFKDEGEPIEVESKLTERPVAKTSAAVDAGITKKPSKSVYRFIDTSSR